MRCLTLAEALRDCGAEVSFFCRLLPGDLCELVVGRGFCLNVLSTLVFLDVDRFNQDKDAAETQTFFSGHVDWMVVDHYGLDISWEAKVRKNGTKVLVVDDLANRRHECDLLLDQNFYLSSAGRYEGKVPQYCRLLLGPKFALLASSFRELAKVPRNRDGHVRRVLVFFGGGDPTRETEKFLEVVDSPEWSGVRFDVVVGGGNPLRYEIEARCRKIGHVRYHCQTPYMAELCWKADLAIGAGGSANWERCVLGLPALVIITAENQRETTTDLFSFGAVKLIGEHSSVFCHDIRENLRWAVRHPFALASMGCSAKSVLTNEFNSAVFIAKLMLMDGFECAS
jgi:UDP-2,4-diacetamido-2,4,6-trideoxy-beta-L-altropyranose hydrolase